MKQGFAVQTPTENDFNTVREFIINTYGVGKTFVWNNVRTTVIGYWGHMGKNYAGRTTLQNFREKVKGVELYTIQQFKDQLKNKLV